MGFCSSGFASREFILRIFNPGVRFGVSEKVRVKEIGGRGGKRGEGRGKGEKDRFL